MATIFKGILKVMWYIMPLCYLAAGLLLTFTKFFGDETGKFQLALGILLMGYSVFRAWRIIKDHKNQEENETSED